MSSSSVQPPPSDGARASPLGIGFGALLLILAAVGFAGPSLGLPINIAPAVAAAMVVGGVGFILPSFIPLKASQDYAAGIFIIAIATVGIVGSLGLTYKTSTGVGPGMMPRSTGLILVALGIILIINSLFVRGQGLDRWSIRGIIFVLGSALVFAWTIRPLGLIVAGPLAVIVSAFADRDTRIIEVLIFGFVMTFACIALFSWGLKLPIPIWPTQTPPLPFVPTIRF
jgi:putative tricarboxylic transport membrane protein